ncbi:MAG TPA: hypothetical protein VFG05_00585 [Methylocella sp.]|nr:hypothetical protein [Methylocella sp.]
MANSQPPDRAARHSTLIPQVAKEGEAALDAGAKESTAAYIAELSGELVKLAHKAHFTSLAQLLARAQLEAELWARLSKPAAGQQLAKRQLAR